MLSSLTIDNIVLIDHLTIEFENNLCALTGETGAGKSILLDSLGLSIGARANAKLVRHGCEKATVSAEFFLSNDHPVLSFLQEHELETDNTLILKRVLRSDGRSKAFINDQIVSAGLLRQAGEFLIEIHGQFDNQRLFDSTAHVGFLDAYADNQQDLNNLRAKWQSWRTAREEKNRLQEKREVIKEEEEYLRQSLHDLDALAPEQGEEESLTVLKNKLKNLTQLKESSSIAASDIEEIQAVTGNIWRVLEKIRPESDQALEACDRVNAELAELSDEVTNIVHGLDREDRSLEDIDDRLFALKTQSRKHQCSIDELPLKRDEIAQSLNEIENIDDIYREACQKEEKQKDIYKKQAEKISKGRQTKAKDLISQVEKELPLLKLEKAKFTISFEEKDETHWNEDGIDDIEFLVSTNPGSDFGRIQNIASGGELARFTLALKVVLAGAEDTGTLVFDEVDSGIGGATAAAVGDRLAKLAKYKQVLVVTHSPQVAAKANYHWIVKKSGEKEVTTAIVALSEEKNRQEEIARMLSAEEITEEARAA
ncbi:MAG: DNA repair protein RecN, partial [Pseudomonadota bacterium]